MAPAPLQIDTSRHGRWTVARVRGDLDMATTPTLESRVDSVDGPLALDLSEVGFIDSTGVRALIGCRESSDRFALVAPSAVVQRLLVLAGLTESFVTVASVADLGT